MKHLFLEKIYRFDTNKKKKDNLADYLYNSKLGYWIDKKFNPCITDVNFAKPQTKKCDCETGEDKKGE